MGNLAEGESVDARTWVASEAVGAKFDRFAEFSKNGRVIVRARTTWAILSRESLRPLRVPKEVVARFE
jgi:acyl-CoA thioester hydrolase